MVKYGKRLNKGKEAKIINDYKRKNQWQNMETSQQGKNNRKLVSTINVTLVR